LSQRFLRLVEQSRVLDGDHGLIGEGLQQVDVMGCEGPGLRPRRVDHAYRCLGVHERDQQKTAEATLPPRLP